MVIRTLIPVAFVPKYMEFYHTHTASLRISFLTSSSYSDSHYTYTESIRNYQLLPNSQKNPKPGGSFLQVVFFF